ncbi:hypothetical protein EPA93_44465 [Ktedonosporobacter rubrisoli]|uniref:4-vinyl reductase 4VR domain-containing protein n=1 Tax=Ktedonosporobacter rubrisoli TaxID=2509675 RepID=A0A4P6K397_KTERU|nr:heme NO-binding domain-containing protein [Ktedonosporobacter rubrisoli]QBD82649.1 hypothetical protein EPA93_44465 [Ktedonosporobacter rubrisoli]
MQGLIMVTWEKFLMARFGHSFLSTYREALGEINVTSLLTSHVYDDELLRLGVSVANQLTGLPTSTLLREYGRYFITNGLTSHLCAYLLGRVHNARELLLIMREAHSQMRRTPDKLTPPIFSYETISHNPNEFMLIYESPRKMCAVLHGAIEGAAERFGEKVRVTELTCMKLGADACRFEVLLTANPQSSRGPIESPEQQQRRRQQQQLADTILSLLPDKNGITLQELQQLLQMSSTAFGHTRLSVLLEALQHLQFAGLVASTANQQAEDLTHRHYWRVPTSDKWS